MKRILALLTLILSLVAFGGAATPSADAVNTYPHSMSVKGIVDVLYWDLDTFWGKPQQKPGVSYYNYWQNGQLMQFYAGCTWTTAMVGRQGFYCPGGHIYFDTIQQYGNLTQVGDGAVAFFMAHEYAHHAEWFLGIGWGAPYHEQLADCFAGLYFRYGVYSSRKLVYNDYLEARTQLLRTGTGPDYGTAAQRLKAFDYGFRSRTYHYTNCTSGWQYWS